MDYIAEIEHHEFVICVEVYRPGFGCPSTAASDVDVRGELEYVVKLDGEIVEVSPSMHSRYIDIIEDYFRSEAEEDWADMYYDES